MSDSIVYIYDIYTNNFDKIINDYINRVIKLKISSNKRDDIKNEYIGEFIDYFYSNNTITQPFDDFENKLDVFKNQMKVEDKEEIKKLEEEMKINS